jgi:hypothetical protein
MADTNNALNQVLAFLAAQGQTLPITPPTQVSDLYYRKISPTNVYSYCWVPRALCQDGLCASHCRNQRMSIN